MKTKKHRKGEKKPRIRAASAPCALADRALARPRVPPKSPVDGMRPAPVRAHARRTSPGMRIGPPGRPIPAGHAGGDGGPVPRSTSLVAFGFHGFRLSRTVV